MSPSFLVLLVMLRDAFVEAVSDESENISSSFYCTYAKKARQLDKIDIIGVIMQGSRF